MSLAIDFTGRVAIVTGVGGGNLGAATARLFAAHGASVVCGGLDDAGGMRIAEEIRSLGGEAVYLHADVGYEAECEGLVRHALDRFGAVHSVVNFAAYNEPHHGTLDTTVEEWEWAFSSRVKGTWLMAKHGMRAMLRNPADDKYANRGAIVCVAGLGAHRGGPDWVAYHAANAGILGLTRAMAADGGPHRIRVNCLCPGATQHDDGATTREYDRLARSNRLLDYAGVPRDQAAAALWLCSDHARFVTGAILDVDGGARSAG